MGLNLVIEYCIKLLCIACHFNFQGFNINVFIKENLFKTQKSYLSHMAEIHISNNFDNCTYFLIKISLRRWEF